MPDRAAYNPIFNKDKDIFMTQQNTTGVHGGNGIKPETDNGGVHGSNFISPATGNFAAHSTTSQKQASAIPVITISIGEVKLSVFAPA